MHVDEESRHAIAVERGCWPRYRLRFHMPGGCSRRAPPRVRRGTRCALSRWRWRSAGVLDAAAVRLRRPARHFDAIKRPHRDARAEIGAGRKKFPPDPNVETKVADSTPPREHAARLGLPPRSLPCITGKFRRPSTRGSPIPSAIWIMSRRQRPGRVREIDYAVCPIASRSDGRRSGR